MAKFWDNVSGPLKVLVLFGAFILAMAAIAIFPDEFQRLADTVMDGLKTVGTKTVVLFERLTVRPCRRRSRRQARR